MEDDDAPISRGRSRSNRVEITEDNDNIDPDGPPLPVLHETSSSSSGSNIIDSNSENFNTTTGDTTTTINNNNNQEEDGPPMYDPTLLSFDSPPDDSNAGDDDDESDDSEEEDDDDEPLPRTRARSKSVFDPYGALENEKGVVLINPSVIEEIASKAAAGAVTPTASGTAESQLLKQQQSLERKGPLQMREVEALRKVSSNII